MPFVRPFFDTVVDYLFPAVCLSCGNLLADRRVFLCPECLSRLHRVDRQSELFLTVRDRLARGEILSDLLSPFVFEKESPLQSVIHAVKYQGIGEAARWLGEFLGCELNSLGYAIDMIIPVPLHKVRHRERGYNQADLIAQGIRRVHRAEIFEDAILRVRNTSTQTKLTAEARQKNVMEAFRVNPKYSLLAPGRTILIVDDVITTGSTLLACAEPLAGEGAASILAGSIAIADKA